MQENEDGRERCVGAGTRMCTQDKWEGAVHAGWVCRAPWRGRDQVSSEDWLSLPAKQTAFTLVRTGRDRPQCAVCLPALRPFP